MLRTTATPRELSGMKLGRYYALVIGNQNYQKIEPLRTPLNDARRAAQLLMDKYAFSVTVINDTFVPVGGGKSVHRARCAG